MAKSAILYLNLIGIDWTGLGCHSETMSSGVFGKFNKIRFLALYASGRETDKE